MVFASLRRSGRIKIQRLPFLRLTSFAPFIFVIPRPPLSFSRCRYPRIVRRIFSLSRKKSAERSGDAKYSRGKKIPKMGVV